MKRFGFLAALVTASVGSLTAHVHPCPGQWGFAGELLYFYPSMDDTYFVLKTNDGAGLSGHWINNDFNLVPGFRVEGAYTFCGCEHEVVLSYARVSNSHSKTISGTGLSATAGSPFLLGESALGTVTVAPQPFTNFTGSARSVEDTLYQRGDALLEWKIWKGCPFDFYMLAGLQGAYLRLHENIYYTANRVGATPVTYKTEQRPRTWGLGPEFGIEFSQDIWDVRGCYCPGTLSVVGLATTSILACQAQPLFRAQNPFLGTQGFFPEQSINPEHTWKLVPSLQARLGLSYQMTICGFSTCWEIGYEWTSYIRALSKVTIDGDGKTIGTLIDPTDVVVGAAPMAHLEYVNYDIQGFYASIGGSF